MKSVFVLLLVVILAGCSSASVAADEGWVRIKTPCPSNVVRQVWGRISDDSNSDMYVVCNSGELYELK